MKDKNNVLVALMNSINDFEIAKEQKWYRIPVKSAPKIIKEGNLETIAFYHNKSFKDEQFLIKYYSKVEKISIVKRIELLPNEYNNKSNNDYYKIEFSTLKKLNNPIISKRGRRILFIPTTEEKFFNASEINHLFNNSKLENILWEKLIQREITAERQYFFNVDNFNFYVLDFAVFCKKRNINIECDGDTFHNNKFNIQYDKNRNNILESKGWSVLRFTTEDIKNNIDNSLNIIYKTINNYGGF